MKSKQIAYLSVLTAASLIIFVLENLLVPIIPFAPFVKLGLSNCVLIFVLYKFGVKQSFIVLIIKIVLGSLFSGNFYAFTYNIAGGFCSLAAMSLLVTYLQKYLSVVSISVCGAVVSNIARIMVSAIIMQTAGFIFWLPAALIISVFSGVITGALAIFLKAYLPQQIYK